MCEGHKFSDKASNGSKRSHEVIHSLRKHKKVISIHDEIINIWFIILSLDCSLNGLEESTHSWVRNAIYSVKPLSVFTYFWPYRSKNHKSVLN